MVADLQPSFGGTVQVGEQGKEIRSATSLPGEAFRLTGVTIINKVVTAESLAVFKDCKDLRQLDLCLVKATDAGLVHFKGCKELTHLYLRTLPMVTDAGLANLAGLQELELLELKGTGITDAGLEHVAQLSGLKQLYVGDTSVTVACADFAGFATDTAATVTVVDEGMLAGAA